MEKPVSLLEFAYKNIKGQILSGEMPPGHKLAAKTISEQLSISQTPVKEAINRLIAEGFVQSIPRKGHIVSRLSMKDIRDMIDVRIMMECHAARYAVANLHKHPDMIRRMEDLLVMYDRGCSLSYMEASEVEQEFHNLYMRLSENNRLITLYRTDWSVSLMYFLYSSTNYPMEKLADALASHRPQFEMMVNGDVKGLETLIGDTMTSVLQIFLDLVAKDNSDMFIK